MLRYWKRTVVVFRCHALQSGAFDDVRWLRLCQDVDCRKGCHHGLHLLRRSAPPWLAFAARQDSRTDMASRVRERLPALHGPQKTLPERESGIRVGGRSRSTTQRALTTLFRPELSIVAGHLSYAQLAPKEHRSRIRVVSVGTPQGTTVVVNRRALTAASAALFCLFLLYVLFGAGAMTASSSTSSGQTMFDGLFWIFLQFTTTSSNPYATFGTSPGARGGWALYYAVGALQLAAVAYMAFALVTWRCEFCADNWTAQSSQA
ncbi:uncharacterized protein LOC119445140 [Dermacentor silvarum]|uniref:uncharacterized protein LOC119445140 n=1 Tax=Dermacentor silvarum TaxID=543639 RepID=UPI002100ACBF|nr:uncharacterized protein LOC119445140 [Dermacentor silvarum]